MRFHKSLTSGFLLLFVLLGCNKPPNLSEVPSISFENVAFEVKNEGDPLNESTALTISINVEDGDGDLGLDGMKMAFLITRLP